MLAKKLFMAVLAGAALTWVAAPAAAQAVFDPSDNSCSQITPTDTPAATSAPLTTITRRDFSFMGLAMLWSQMAWMPASPLQMPTSFALLAPGDRRWGIR